ncbi:flagellar biosynthesis/type III secretory pathway protein FliH [Cupriavidus gilardii J11]|uniref:Flagellar biosynthesis/type III secretory pathway protein FliH n=1 Tax=Cupriavidus gilardii J11 TaxID=936133 RepID=A0A562BII1_9BURK|nr:hypothetical protein [Cupriavidus gilardii]TWG84966.1 flagellar biosynthesis/type III secretory pathway protein FliH [Cupriavidus gilardii J11]
MNPFDLNVAAIAGELPIGGVIPADRLDRYIDAAAVLQRNRSRAAAVLVAARRHRDRIRRQAEEVLHEAYEEAERRAAQAAREAHDETCATVVRWLVEEHELERVLATRLEARCRAWVCDAIRVLVADSDRTATLVSRIDAQLRGLMPHGDVTLRVCPAEHDAVVARLPSDRPFDIEVDTSLERGQARLDSPYVQLRIDLGRHLSSVLRAIGGTEEMNAPLDADAGAEPTNAAIAHEAISPDAPTEASHD